MIFELKYNSGAFVQLTKDALIYNNVNLYGDIRRDGASGSIPLHNIYFAKQTTVVVPKLIVLSKVNEFLNLTTKMGEIRIYFGEIKNNTSNGAVNMAEAIGSM